jgi:DNA-binding NtrC family response regulator
MSKYPYPILVVDDEPATLDVMSVNLEKRNYMVDTAINGAEAIEKEEKNSYAAVILDYSLPDMDGFQVLSAMKNRNKDLLIIMITAYGTIEMAVEAMKSGVFNYLVKPINFEEMGLVVDKAVEHHKLVSEIGNLKKQLGGDFVLENIIGTSEKMRKIFEKVKIVAASDATVLVRGETGTGKELIARAIHMNSSRAKKNFVRVNCAAIPETLLESELFGYEKGAFTGAVNQHIGRFEKADKGTILLDEIGEISMEMQSKLLRVLQEGEFNRVGGNQTLTTNTRVIATTNRNLEEGIEQGKFRSDLFYRLNVIPIDMPSLSERSEDIPILVMHFVKKYCGKNRVELKTVSASVMATFSQHDWPGNVRELENAIERAVVLSQGEALDQIEIPGHSRNGNGLKVNIGGSCFQDEKKNIIESFEEKYLSSMLMKHKGNISASARESGLDYKNFHSKLKKYNIKKREYEDA